MLLVVMSLALTSMVMAVPHRYNQPFDREISLANLLDEKKQFSRADLDYYLKIFTDYKDYVPKEIKMIFNGLTEATKNEMVKAVNDIETGAVKIPNNVQQITDYITKRTPQVGDNVDKAMDTLMDNLNKLQPETKTLFKKWWKRLFDSVSVPVPQLANSLADLIADFEEAYNNADATVKNDVRSVWPEAYNLLESDFADNFAEAARKFVKAGPNADIRSLSADADYPPKAPKVRISNRQGSYLF
ncbi:unnamed protein product [Nippostrongylus brasiliensis]|uniref:Fatty-acid and retinol-binding protein 1 n=1 Tax=Nippostrongylus brasiliensis TaxID=27835 RepID=A0A0N4YER6_NIPBR|nr:unnamed protein product [Nippostrongylus brasiliensis]